MMSDVFKVSELKINHSFKWRCGALTNWDVSAVMAAKTKVLIWLMRVLNKRLL